MAGREVGPDPLVTPSQAASYLGVTVGTLATWRCTKRYPLPWVRIGRKVMYRASDLAHFVESRVTHGEPRE